MDQFRHLYNTLVASIVMNYAKIFIERLDDFMCRVILPIFMNKIPFLRKTKTLSIEICVYYHSRWEIPRITYTSAGKILNDYLEKNNIQYNDIYVHSQNNTITNGEHNFYHNIKSRKDEIIKINSDIQCKFLRNIRDESQVNCYVKTAELSSKNPNVDVVKWFENIIFEYNNGINEKKPKTDFPIIRYRDNNRYNNTYVDKSQTFDNIYGNIKNIIIKKIDQLRDKKYFEKYGLKRKISMLLYGRPGCGKTCIVSAIANYTKRNIMKIDLSRIKKNSQFFREMYCDTTEYKKSLDNWIILLDEIDSSKNKLNKNQRDQCQQCQYREFKNKDEDQTTDDDDEFNFGVFLSILDGIYDQDGLIIIATANSLDNIDSSLYREGRLELVNIEYWNQNEIAEIIEKYYDIKLSADIAYQIRNDKKIPNLTIKNICADYNFNNRSIDELINNINSIVPTNPL